MGFFGSLIKTAMDVVETPVAMLKDAATLGGALTDQDKPYTQQKLENLGDDWNKLKEETENI